MTDSTRLIDRVTAEDLAAYLAWEMTSTELAAKLGVAPASVRRAITRPKRPTEAERKAARKAETKKLTAARKAWRMSKAHLPRQEFIRETHVSPATADRLLREARQQGLRK